MPRPVGSKNKRRKPPGKSVHVRLTRDELATLATLHPKPGKAVHAAIAHLSACQSSRPREEKKE